MNVTITYDNGESYTYKNLNENNLNDWLGAIQRDIHTVFYRMAAVEYLKVKK